MKMQDVLQHLEQSIDLLPPDEQAKARALIRAGRAITQGVELHRSILKSMQGLSCFATLPGSRIDMIATMGKLSADIESSNRRLKEILESLQPQNTPKTATEESED